MDTITALFAIVLFIFGALVGSFLNVCICRIPAGEDIVTTPSHCPSCGKRLLWYELIPILSWLCLRGRCSGCKRPISAQYPLIEAANGVLWVLTYLSIGWNLYLALCCLMASALLVLSVIDSRTLEIPPGINIFILVLGACALALDFQNWLSHLIGLAAVSLPLLALYYFSGGRAIGGGDIKLMAAAGLFLGWKLIVFAFFAGCIAGAAIHLTRMRLSGADRKLALGPYLAGGIFAAALWGERFLAWYLSVLGLAS